MLVLSNCNDSTVKVQLRVAAYKGYSQLGSLTRASVGHCAAHCHLLQNVAAPALKGGQILAAKSLVPLCECGFPTAGGAVLPQLAKPEGEIVKKGLAV